MTPEQIQEITRLRALELPPKQIARQLGLRPAEVTTIIRQSAETATIARIERGEMAPIEQCRVNAVAAEELLDQDPDLGDDGTRGFAQVMVTRVERGQYIVTVYLVDYWCLGVKDVIGPRKVNRLKYQALLDKVYAGFNQKSREITLEQAQAIVYGAVDYAESLGLKPHKDFEAAKANLGPRPESLPALTFGKDGKPFYIAGPYDNADRILATLRSTVGEDNFHFVSPLDMMGGGFEDLDFEYFDD